MSREPIGPVPEDHFKKASHNYFWAKYLYEQETPKPGNETSVHRAFDWVTTISYYSAIHYLAGYLLEKKPAITYGGNPPTRYSCVNDFHKVLRDASKHAASQLLVAKIKSEIKGDWKFLADNAHLARYKEYNVSPKIAEKALSALGRIKAAFTT